MPEDHTQGLATESSGETVQQQNSRLFEASFNEALSGTRTEQSEKDAPVPSVTTTETKPAAPSADKDAEFPAEIMTGEKPAVEAPKDDLDDIVPSPKLGEQQRSNFQKLKELTREARAEAARIKAELEEIRKAPPVVADTEAVKAAHARAAELEKLVERTRFESSPKYQAIVADRNASIADAKAYVEGTEIDPRVIDYAASLTGPKRIAVLREAGIDSETISAITPHLAHADRKERERSQALEQSAALRTEWEQEQASQAEAKKAQERAEEDRIYAQTGEIVAKQFEPFQIIPGAEKWNAQVEQLKAQAKEFFNGNMNIDQMAEIAYYGVGAKVIHKLFHQQRAELKAVKEQLAKMSAAQPNGGSAPNGATETNAAPRTAQELFDQRMRGFESVMGR